MVQPEQVPADWVRQLDLADARADEGDFAGAVTLVVAARKLAPTEILPQAAEAAYRTRLTGSSLYLRELIDLAPRLRDATRKARLIAIACAAPKLPRAMVKTLRNA
jgi:hypothetical protein